MRAGWRALVVALGLAGGGCDEGEQLARVIPRLSVEPGSLDFGEVPLGATRRGRLTLVNEGAAPLRWVDLAIEAPFALTPGGPTEGQLPPGGRQLLDLGFRPDSVEPASGTLVVSSDDPETPRLEVVLRGEGVEGALTALPDRIDLTNTPVGSGRGAEVLLENRGLAPVSGRVVLESARPGYFEAEGGPLERDFTVAPRGQLALAIGYRPLEPGDHGGRLRFETCGERCGVEVELAATAIRPTVRLDPPMVDFGEVGLGERRVVTLAVINEGDGPVTVTRVGARGAPEVELAPVRAPPAVLEPGDRLGVDVGFAPREALELAGTVEVDLDDPSFPRAEAGLVGRGVGPRFAVTPARVDFGVQTTPRSSRRSLVGLNAGSSRVEVRAVEIAGDPELSLGALPGFPVSLGAGETVPVEVVYTPNGLGASTATVTLRSSDPMRPELRVSVRAGLAERVCALSVRPAGAVNFGAVVPGFERDRRVIVRNEGVEACTLRSGGFRAPVDPAFRRLGLDPFPLTLNPAEELSLEFRFAPSAERESKAVFALRTDEPLFPVRNLSFVGTGAGYLDLFTRPRVLDFGEVGIDCPPERRAVELVNAGSGPVTVDRVTLTSTGAALALEPVATPFDLPAGRARRLGAVYDPTRTGSDAGLMVVEVRGLPFPLVVPVLGEGAVDPRVRVGFEQPPREDVDVLFVIDDSCSMADEQQAIARNFQSFIMQADLRQVDFRIGVTTTTVRAVAGGLVGPPLDRRTPDLARAFAQQTAVGIRGSGIEMGLEATLGAVREAERGRSPNNRLFRADANKVFVIVSDEDDQSPLSPLTYATALERRFGAPTAAVVSGEERGCGSANGSATASPRYTAFLDEIGGISASICADWGQTLSAIGQAAFGLQSRFPLGRRVDPAFPLTVTIDGRVIPPDRYALDATGEAVIIDPPPPAGSEIVVELTPAC